MNLSEEEVKKKLIEAVKLAHLAVKNDTQDGNLQKASHQYLNAVALFEEVLPNLSGDLKPSLQERIEAYQQRVGVLAEYFRNMKQIYSEKGIAIGDKGRNFLRDKKVSQIPEIIFKEDHTLLTKFMALPPPPPEQPELRAFWLIDIISRSIKSGSFITANIWIPKEVWTQSNIHLTSQVEKIACLKLVEELCSKLDANKIKDLRTLPSELETLYEDLASVQNHLAFMVDSINEIKITLTNSRDKKIYAQRKNLILERIQAYKEEIDDIQCVDTTEYISSILAVLQSATIFEKIFKQIGDSKDSVMTKIFDLNKKITLFLNSTIIWILYDLGLLLKEYIRKSKENFLYVPDLLEGLDDDNNDIAVSNDNIIDKEPDVVTSSA